MAGVLYLTATPIGNLEDMTLRAVDVLRSVDLIAAEDTRHSRILMDHFDIKTPLTSYHEHNKYEKADKLISLLLQGQDIAVVTDAGTPGISDPGEVLAAKAIEAGIRVTSLPGACALITALTMSAMPARRFVFEGFLPTDKKERTEVLTDLRDEKRTIILYEAPHRLKKTLTELLEALGDRRIVICRELTKIHEEAVPLMLSETAAYYEAEEPRGEYVLILAGKSREQLAAEQAERWEQVSPQEHLQHYLDQGLDRKEAMKKMAADLGLPKREIYKMLTD